MTTTPIYYQYQKSGTYPIYLRVDSLEIEEVFMKAFSECGFVKLDETTYKKIALNRSGTRVLKITKAGPKASKQIRAFSGMDQYGEESITPMGAYDVYRYRGIGMIMMQEKNISWELGVVLEGALTQERKLKVLLNRFLSYALAPLGVVGFWGTLHENSLVITKAGQSGGEAFFIDYKIRKVLSSSETELFQFDQIIRMDESLRGKNKLLSREELIGFLTANTSFLSYKGIEQNLKHYCYEIASELEGVVVPKEDFETSGLEL